MALMMRDMFFKLNDIKSKIQSGQDISHEQLRFPLFMSLRLLMIVF